MQQVEEGYCLACGNTHLKGWDCKGQNAMSKPRDPLLVEREKTHGAYHNTASIAQDLKAVMSRQPCRPIQNPVHRESLNMIATKLARILSGDANAKDHWDDIAGYAKLGAEACE